MVFLVLFAVLLTIVVGPGILSFLLFLLVLIWFQNFKIILKVIIKNLINKVSQFQEWLAVKFDYKMTIDAEKVISTIQSYVLNFIGGAADFLKDFFIFVVILMMFFLSEGGGFSRKLGAVKEADGPDLCCFF